MKNKTVLILYIVTFSMILMIANAASSHNSFYLVIQNVNCHFSNFILFLSNVTVYFSPFLPDGTNLSNLLKIPFSHSSPKPFREDELLLSDGKFDMDVFVVLVDLHDDFLTEFPTENYSLSTSLIDDCWL